MVDAVRAPEVPVMVTVDVPSVAVALALRVSTLVPVVGLVANRAVTPLGKPVAARVTLPVNPPAPATVIVSVALLPCPTDRVGGEAESVNPGLATVRAMVVDAASVPEVPAMVTLDVPAAAVLLAVKVSVLLAVAGLVPNAAVTPLGRPDAARVTAPVNPPRSVTVMVSLPRPPWAIERAGAEAESVKAGGPVTVRETFVDAVSTPEVPVTVTVEVPTVAVALAASVSTLVPVVGLVPNVAVTPLGRPDAARVTLPVNPGWAATEMVSVALAPWATDKEGAEAESEKLGVVPPVQVVPLTAKVVGTALVMLFQVPLNPRLL